MSRSTEPGHSPADLARAFIAAFNAGDLDAFLATLHPEIEIHGGRGTRRGLDAARAWATRAPGGIQQTIVAEDLLERGGQHVVALIVREWRWDEESGEDLAGREEMAWLFRLEDGVIREWRPFDDRADALASVSGP